MPAADSPSEPPFSDENETIETTFRRLRADGHSRLEAVRIILDTLEVSLNQAKRLLLTNDTWAEAQDASSNDDSSPSVPPAPG